MIARYTCDRPGAPVLTMQRIVVEDGYAYPFIFRQYYSDKFILSDDAVSKDDGKRARSGPPFDSLVWKQSLSYISERGDTLLERSARNGVAYVPLTITAKTRIDAVVATYSVDSVYQENIDDKPSVSLFKQFRPLGWYKDCRDYCD